MQNILFLIRTFFTRGSDSQTFIGANWVVWALRACPRRWRRSLALRILAWSPHYFYRDMDAEYQHLSYGDFLEREFGRNRDSRKRLRDEILSSFLRPEYAVLDYGCGPGFLAAAVAEQVTEVIAIDVSKGVIECAATINQAENLRYVVSSEFARIADESIDLSYSFAVIQHVTDEVFSEILGNVLRALKPGGKLAFHVVLQQPGWKPQSDWEADDSLKGKVKLEFGLNCFSREKGPLIALVEDGGFENVAIQPVENFCTENFDDICRQHFLTARKPAPAS